MIAIVDYGAGNLRSLQKGCEKVGLDVCVSADEEDLFRADKLILPGVGAFRGAMETLCARGVDRILRGAVADGKPVLGICLGHQLLFSESEEDGVCRGLGLIPGRVAKIEARGQKVPHTGWNSLRFTRRNALFENIEDGALMYFVHSYAVVCESRFTVATTEYGTELTASVQNDHIFGVQFHPEKSGERGLRILKNFGAL